MRFDWNRARAFLVTAEEGSLSAAARALGMAQPTLGRQVTALEEELGTVLFERVGRGLELTPSGVELVEHVRAMGEAASRISLTASGQSQSIEGTVCITTSEAGSAFLLPPIVQALRAEHPGITVEILASNAVRDLRRREADIAVRSVEPTDPELIARRLKDTPAELFCAERYLARHGPFDTPADLARAEFIGFADNEDYFKALSTLGAGLTARNFPYITANHLVHWELVRQGAGIGVMLSSVGEAEPCIVRAVPWVEPWTIPIWLVSHRALKTSRRVRLVYDWLADALG